MKKIKILMLSAVACCTMASCSDDFFEVENASIVSKDQIDEIGNSSPDALIKIRFEQLYLPVQHSKQWKYRT